SPTQARLVGIRPDASRGQFALVLEASSPVAYVTRQPDPLTVLLDLRNVALGDVSRGSTFDGTPVRRIDIQPAKASDGAPTATVRLAPPAPGRPRARPDRNAIRVECAESAAPAGAAAAAASEAAVVPAAAPAAEPGESASAVALQPATRLV